MKDFHPVGVAKNSAGYISHFLLKDTTGSGGSKFSDTYILVVSPDEFTQLVKDNRVQLFMWNDQEVVHAYTAEERKIFKRAINELGSMTIQEYFAGEAVFHAGLIDNPNAVNFSIVLLRVAAILSAPVLTGAVYMPHMPAPVVNSIKRNSLYSKLTSRDYMVCNWEINKFLSLLSSLSVTYQVTCNADTMCNPGNPMNGIKTVGFRAATVEDLESAQGLMCDLLDPPQVPPSPGVRRMNL